MADGWGHMSNGTSVIFERPTSQNTLAEPVRKAWIRLRHLAPLIAARTQNRDDAFVMSYEFSIYHDAAARWAAETIKWETREKTFETRDLDLKETWWKTDGHWNMEMHVGPAPEGRCNFM